MIDALTAFIVENSASPWALIAVFALSMLDGLIPPLPSESIVIALAAISASTGAPSLVILGLCAAIGAFLGDNLTFLIARHSGVGRLANSSRPRVQRAFGWAATELHRRSGLAIIVARYIPVGRIAVNLTAGASRFSYPRFIALDMVAVTAWAAYSVAVGALAGRWIENHPFVAAFSGIGFAVLTGLLVDALLRRTGLSTSDSGPTSKETCAKK